MSLALHALENDPEYLNLQTEMVRLQKWVNKKNKKLIIIFEGRDSAGKGGAIMRFNRFLNPKCFKVVALDKPTKSEKKQWYFKRYIQHLPEPGEIAFFDRSWYNRAVVEPAMGFCSEKEYKQFFKHVNQLEKMLVEAGYILIKFWVSIDKEEQDRRLKGRQENPLIDWKLSPIDLLAQEKWDVFTQYKEAMFIKTSSPEIPWVKINGNEKDIARKEAMRYVLSTIPYEKKKMTGERLIPDENIITILDSPEKCEQLGMSLSVELE